MWSEETDQATAGIEQAYTAFASELRRYASGRIRSVDGAEDLVQEAFLRFATEARAGREPQNPRAWLYRVVHNLIVSGSRRAQVARRDEHQPSFEDLVDHSSESVVLGAERDRALATALLAAGGEGRTGLLLAAHGYSGREIARHLGRSEGSTRTLMCRARGQVRRELTRSDVAFLVA